MPHCGASNVNCLYRGSKLIILYKPDPPPEAPRGDTRALLCPPDSAGAGGLRRSLGQSFVSYAEPVTVRASTWLCLRTSLGSFAFWCGPVLKRTWASAEPVYTVEPHPGGGSDRGFGCQVYMSWGQVRGGLSVLCVSNRRHCSLGDLFSVGWSARFPCIVPQKAEIFDFVQANNLAAVQLMFGASKATPWDTAPDGRGLLHASLGSTGSPISFPPS